jgi:hypothetical protein
LLTPGDVFSLDPRIRWAALVSESNQIVFSEMRRGVESYTSDDEDRAFMEMGPLFITGIAERLTPLSKAGNLDCVIACFEKDCVLMAKVREGHLALSADTPDAFAVFQEIRPQLHRLQAK